MKAQVFGVLASIVFIFFFALIFRVDLPPKRVPAIKYIPVPAECPSVEQPKVSLDSSERFKLVPLNFMNVDFRNRSFGSYTLSSGKIIDLALKGGDYDYKFKDGELGWFHLRDVYFADVTGDDTPEAIVWLLHIQCGVSCDGGRSMFYVYTNHDGHPEQIWQYEAGSYDDLCGLKSITAMNKQIVLQMFGRCEPGSSQYSVRPKSEVAHVTMLNFRFNGQRFVKTQTEFISIPPTDVRTYEPQINIIQ